MQFSRAVSSRVRHPGLWSRGLFACAVIVLGGWTLSAQRATAPEIAKGPNTLFGRVVDAGTGAPVGGAQVTLFAYAGATRTSAPQSVIAGGDGAFFFGQLPAGHYAVFASAFGYLTGSYLAGSGGPTHLIDVADSDRPSPVVVQLRRYGAISGTVVDDRGDPVVDAPVEAFTRAGTGVQQAGVAVRTDDRGAYRIAIAPGSYVVGVVTSARTIPAALGAAIDATSSDPLALYDVMKDLASTLEFDLTSSGPGHVPNGEGTRVGDWLLQRKGPMAPPSPDGRMLAYATTLYPNAAVPADATTVNIKSGEERGGIDMALRASPAVTISGVLSAQGESPKNISVQLRPTRTGDDRDVLPNGQSTTITSATGAFAFLGVPQGQYVLASLYVTPEDPNAGTRAILLSGRQALMVGDRDLSGVTLTLKPGLHVSGRVEFRDSHPPMQGRPSINFRPSTATIWRSLPAYLAEDGTFESDTEPGRYQLILSGVPGNVVSISLGGQKQVDQTVTIDRSVSDLVIAVSSTAQHVSGTVVESNGAPATRANVIMFPADTTTWRDGVLSDKRRCAAAATSTGAFDCAGISPGDYYAVAIDAQTPFRIDDANFLDRLVPGASRVTLADTGDATVALKVFTPKERQE